MRVYLGIKYHADQANRERIERISRAFTDAGFEVRCVTRDIERWGEVEFEPQALMAATFELMGACDLAVLDLSEKGVGVGIEAGFAHAIGKPVVTIAQAGSDISSTLRGISSAVFEYASDEDLAGIAATLARR